MLASKQCGARLGASSYEDLEYLVVVLVRGEGEGSDVRGVGGRHRVHRLPGVRGPWSSCQRTFAKFHNHGEGSYLGPLLVENAYYHFESLKKTL